MEASKRLAMGLAALLTCLLAGPAGAGTAAHQPTPYPGGHWRPEPARYAVLAHRDVKVRMDDGVYLVADVYYPATRSGRRAPGRFPVLLQQTPYTNMPSGAPSNLFLPDAVSGGVPGGYLISRGYIFVSADVRGTGRSGGNAGFFSPRNAKDGVDLVHWVARLPGSNGVVGLYGCSYLAQSLMFTAALLGPHSPVKAMLPECISGDNYRDTYLENGIPGPSWDGAGCCAGSELGQSTQRYVSQQYLESQRGGDTAYYRTWWRERDHVAQAAAVVRTGIPALLWDGWYEPGFGALELYDALQNAYFHRPIYTPLRPGEPVTGRYQLIIGNWRHGGGIDPGIELEWFDTWLKHINTGLPTGTRTPIHVEELGDNRWVNLADYPMTSRYAPWFLGAGGTLTRIAPAGPGADAIVWAPPAQSSVAYTTPALSRGATLAGPLDLTVYAQSSGSDIELMADLFDVAPDGTSRQISHGGELGSMRALDPAKSWTDAAGRPIRPYLALLNDDLLPAGRLFRYDIPIQPQVWLLAPGHRLRLRISGQPDPAACQAGFENVPWMVIGCKPRPAITALLVGDTFVIGRAKGAASYLNLPLLPYRYFRTIRSGITPTSRGVVLPLSW